MVSVSDDDIWWLWSGFDADTFQRSTKEVQTDSTLELLSEIEVMATATVLVTTYSSSLGRFMSMMRTARGHAFVSTISVDRDWSPIRSRDRRDLQGGENDDE